MKIKHTIYIILLAFTVLPLAVFGSFMIVQNNQNIESTMKENLMVASGAQILDIENFSRTRKENMDVLCQMDLVQDALAESLNRREKLPEKERDYLNNTLISKAASNEFSESFSIMDKNFRVVASSKNFTYGEISELKNAYPEFLTGEFVFSNVLNSGSRGNDKKIVAAIMGIYKGEELVGYVVEEINLLFFERIRTGTHLWEDGTLYLLDGNGKMITAGDGEEESREEFVSTKEERKDFSEKWAQIDFEAEPSGEILYRVENVSYITYYSKIQYTDWLIMLTVNISRFQKEKVAYTMLTIMAILAVTALFALLNRFISRKLTKPVESIIDTLHKVQTEQNYTLRIENCSRDEIGILGDEINLLLEYIEGENEKGKERQQYLKKMAERDSLTEIYNRKTVEKKLKSMLWDKTEPGRKIVIAVLDVDDFKEYNTRYGHQGGDLVLQYIASVLDGIQGAIAGRMGGDEFVLGMEYLQEEHDIEQIMDEVLKRLNEGAYGREAQTRISIYCSIGIAIVDAGQCAYENAIQKADKALYQAKANGKNQFAIMGIKD